MKVTLIRLALVQWIQSYNETDRGDIRAKHVARRNVQVLVK
jgi:hypothetical protein